MRSISYRYKVILVVHARPVNNRGNESITIHHMVLVFICTEFKIGVFTFIRTEN
jgi:hypothetical protein